MSIRREVRVVFEGCKSHVRTSFEWPEPPVIPKCARRKGRGRTGPSS